MANSRRLRLAAFAVFTFAFLFLQGLEYLIRPYAFGGLYFQPWTSETMVQALPLQDLRTAPLVSLYYDHIEPPGLDAIRALLVALYPAADLGRALRSVDADLYWLWAILYGLMGMLVFLWCSRLIGMTAALIGSLFFLLHPATIFYATLLDSTFLSSLLILLMFYLLWRIKNGIPVSSVLLASVFLGLFFVRSIFQWPSVLVYLISLFLLKVPRRKLLLFLLLAGGISGLYVAKQYYVFRLASTSSFVGLHLRNSIGMHESYNLDPTEPGWQAGGAQLPGVLTRTYKFAGSINYNNLNYLARNRQFIAYYFSALRQMSAGDLAAAYLQNVALYFRPSSAYWQHAIVDRLPWRAPYDGLFSYPMLPVLLLAAGMPWTRDIVRRGAYAAGLALLLPALYIFMISILFERAENMRFKYFLEPAMFTFLLVQFHRTLQALHQALSAKATPQPSSPNLV